MGKKYSLCAPRRRPWNMILHFKLFCRSRKCFEEVIKQTGRTLYHAVGVAKIGPKDDPMSVVNSRLQ